MIGEFDLIRRYFCAHDKEAHVDLGIGDDCALMHFNVHEQLAITTDTMNEGIHFFKGTDPYLLGYKSLLVNLSDLAAMGAQPCAFTLSITLPESDEYFLAEFSRGLFELASEQRVALIGGNTSKGALSITITAFGITCGKTLLRSKAQVGDGIYVTGSLGGPALYVEAGYDRIQLDKSLLRELCYKSMHMPCRCNFAHKLVQKELSYCALDISDGLTGDLKHILDASHVGADLNLEKLPLAKELYAYVQDPLHQVTLAASGGGDYELLFTVPANKEDALLECAREENINVTKIGMITCHDKLRILYNGEIFAPSLNSFEHF